MKSEEENAPEAVDGLIHISEVAWEKVANIADQFSVGQTIEAVVIGIDSEANRVDLSIKRLQADPFEKIAEKFPVDKKVTGTVTKVSDDGVYVDLGDEVTGIIRKEKIPPSTTYEEGKKVTVTVAEVDKRRHRISLVPVLLEKPLGYR